MSALYEDFYQQGMRYISDVVVEVNLSYTKQQGSWKSPTSDNIPFNAHVMSGAD